MRVLLQRLSVLVLIGIILIGIQSVQAQEVNWKAFSKNLVKAIQSGNDGLIVSAQLMIIKFRNNRDQKARQLALVTLTHMKSNWAMEYLKRQVQFEKDPVIKQQLIALTSESYQQTSSKVDMAVAVIDFNQLDEEIVELSKEEALFTYKNDANGNPLDASNNKYVLKFPNGELPPVQSFWSLAVYNNETHELVQNPLNQYTIQSPMIPAMAKDADGSLVIYIQKEAPTGKKNANWLQAPEAPFYIIMRLYWPEKKVIDGTWKAPSVQLVK
jgi:hypothetical protein